MKPRLLDLFCGAGGAARGYQLAGFHVTGVDINPQPRYAGDEFVQADAMTFPLDGYDAIHASPPCQDHTPLSGIAGKHGNGWMLAATLGRLRDQPAPWVVENVPGAHMPGAYTLCGRSFGIAKLRRHRQFLTSFPMIVPPCACSRRVQPIGVYGDLSRNDRVFKNSKDGIPRLRAGIQTARDLLDCPWMDARELTQAIPPAYTALIGEYLLEHLAVRRT
ncbi:MAG TPA: hypothetical protein VF174_09035 [Micromonosporaceae bacterium]